MFGGIRRKLRENTDRNIREKAEQYYQVKERNGELWLTYNGQTVIPQSMISGDILDVLRKLREDYINNYGQKCEERRQAAL